MDFRIEHFTLVSQITKWSLLNRRTPSARGRLISCFHVLSVSFLFFSSFLTHPLSVLLFLLFFSYLFFNLYKLLIESFSMNKWKITVIHDDYFSFLYKRSYEFNFKLNVLKQTRQNNYQFRFKNKQWAKTKKKHKKTWQSFLNRKWCFAEKLVFFFSFCF